MIHVSDGFAIDHLDFVALLTVEKRELLLHQITIRSIAGHRRIDLPSRGLNAEVVRQTSGVVERVVLHSGQGFSLLDGIRRRGRRRRGWCNGRRRGSPQAGRFFAQLAKSLDGFGARALPLQVLYCTIVELLRQLDLVQQEVSGSPIVPLHLDLGFDEGGQLRNRHRTLGVRGNSHEQQNAKKSDFGHSKP